MFNNLYNFYNNFKPIKQEENQMKMQQKSKNKSKVEVGLNFQLGQPPLNIERVNLSPHPNITWTTQTLTGT